MVPDFNPTIIAQAGGMKTGRHPTTPLSRSKERFLILICLILGTIVLVPILKKFAALRIFLDIFVTAIYISMVYTVSYKKRHLYIGALLAMAMLISLWLQYFLSEQFGFCDWQNIRDSFYL